MASKQAVLTETVILLSTVSQRSEPHPLPYQPNMVNGITERYGYKTSVITMPSGAEQRIQLRRIPTGGISFTLLFDDLASAQEFDLLLEQYQHELWAVPLWPYATHPTATINANDTSITLETIATTLRMLDAATATTRVMLWRNDSYNELVAPSSIISSSLILPSPGATQQYLTSDWIIPTRRGRLTENIAKEWLSATVLSVRLDFTFEAT